MGVSRAAVNTGYGYQDIVGNIGGLKMKGGKKFAKSSFVKGSKEAKERMAYLRSLRGKGRSRGTTGISDLAKLRMKMPKKSATQGGSYNTAALDGGSYNTAALEGGSYNEAALRGGSYNDAALIGGADWGETLTDIGSNLGKTLNGMAEKTFENYSSKAKDIVSDPEKLMAFAKTYAPGILSKAKSLITGRRRLSGNRSGLIATINSIKGTPKYRRLLEILKGKR